MIAQNPDYLVAELAKEYGRAQGLAKSSRQALTYAINSFGRYLTRPPTLADLDRETVNLWLEHELTLGLQPETISGRRAMICRLWADARRQRLVATRPKRIQKIKIPDKPPVCWDFAAELPKLLAVCALLSGKMKKDLRVRRADFWCAYCRVAYDLGLRLGDLRKLRFNQIGADGVVVTVQNKTRYMVIGRLSPESLALIDKIRGYGRQRIFGDLINEKNGQRYFKAIVVKAGLPGSTKWLRRTGATQCEIQRPGSAPDYLGHKSRTLAYTNYVDPRFIHRDKPAPPPIPPA